MQMMKVSIVILNYENFKETEKCINSALEINYDNFDIVVVDNGSRNESYQFLCNKYRGEKKVHIIRNHKNQGFARGNNVGIYYALRKLNADFVMTANSDILFEDKSILSVLLKEYKKEYGIMSCNIRQDGINTYTATVEFPWLLVEFLKMFSQKHNLLYTEKKMDSILQKHPEHKKEVLHGSLLLFTPSYLTNYMGFYPKTFLYLEENILYIICQKFNLKQYKSVNTYVFHKRGASSAAGSGSWKIRINYMLDSYKYLILVALKNKLGEKI